MHENRSFFLGIACALIGVYLMLLLATSGSSERGSGRDILDRSIYATDAEETPAETDTETPTDPPSDRQPRTKVAGETP